MLTANKIFHVTVLLPIYFGDQFVICGIGNSSPQTSLQCLSTINTILSDEDKILIKSLYLKGYTAKRRLTDEFHEKSWTKRDVNKLFKNVRDTGTVNKRPGSGRPRSSARTEKMLSFFFRSSNSLPLTLFCRLSGEVTENIFLSVKKAKSVDF